MNRLQALDYESGFDFGAAGVRETAKKRRVKDVIKIQVNTINKREVAEAMEVILS